MHIFKTDFLLRGTYLWQVYEQYSMYRALTFSHDLFLFPYVQMKWVSHLTVLLAALEVSASATTLGSCYQQINILWVT